MPPIYLFTLEYQNVKNLELTNWGSLSRAACLEAQRSQFIMKAASSAVLATPRLKKPCQNSSIKMHYRSYSLLSRTHYKAATPILERCNKHFFDNFIFGKYLVLRWLEIVYWHAQPLPLNTATESRPMHTTFKLNMLCARAHHARACANNDLVPSKSLENLDFDQKCL